MKWTLNSSKVLLKSSPNSINEETSWISKLLGIPFEIRGSTVISTMNKKIDYVKNSAGRPIVICRSTSYIPYVELTFRLAFSIYNAKITIFVAIKEQCKTQVACIISFSFSNYFLSCRHFILIWIETKNDVEWIVLHLHQPWFYEKSIVTVSFLTRSIFPFILIILLRHKRNWF